MDVGCEGQGRVEGDTEDPGLSVKWEHGVVAEDCRVGTELAVPGGEEGDGGLGGGD